MDKLIEFLSGLDPLAAAGFTSLFIIIYAAVKLIAYFTSRGLPYEKIQERITELYSSTLTNVSEINEKLVDCKKEAIRLEKEVSKLYDILNRVHSRLEEIYLYWPPEKEDIKKVLKIIKKK